MILSIWNNFAYESGWEPKNDVDCLSIIAEEDLGFFDRETHCRKTADKIIQALSDKEIIERDFHCRVNFNTFQKTDPSHLLSTNESEHLLFLISICDDSHVLIIEKNNTGKIAKFRIFQSWLEGFSLSQWLNWDEWTNNEFHSDFLNFGSAKEILSEEVIKLLGDYIKELRPGVDIFRRLLLQNIPWELDITRFRIKS